MYGDEAGHAPARDLHDGADDQQVMRERFEKVVADATGREVIGFMSGNQQDPDMICEVFILAPNDVVH